MLSIRRLWTSQAHDACEPEVAGRVRAAQIHAVAGFAPVTLVANAINVAVVVATIAPEQRLVGGIWAACVFAVLAMATRSWFRGRGKPRRAWASARGIRRVTIQAALLATLWAVVPVLWFGDGHLESDIVIACLMTGMVCAGGFALSTVAPAAHTYVTIIMSGAVVGVGTTDYSFRGLLLALILAYGLVVARSVESYSRLFAERFRAEARLKDRGEIIELLLNEFEESASDWLFETDAAFRITSHSGRFAEAAGRPGASFVGQLMHDLIDEESGRLLDVRIASGEPFRDLELRIETPNGPRWWTLTAKPKSEQANPNSGWRGVGSDVSERKISVDKVAWMARTDLLTGLPNRTHFRDLADQTLARARAGDGSFAIGFLDLDHFKSINDTLGHPVGDALLTTVSYDLSQLAGPSVVFGRVGGDEFGFIATDFSSRSDVLAIADRIIETVSRSRVIDGSRLTVGTSVGLAFGTDGPIDDLIRNADLALYRAKDAGRGQALVYDDNMHREAEERRALQEDLRSALAEDQLRLVYQPIVELASGRVVAFEALMRWQHPERGSLSPSLFVPIAEDTGLIDAIGAWALRRACQDAMAWPQDVRVAVNLSPVQFGQASILRDVTLALDESHLPPSRLELEITEALFVGRHGDNERFLRDIHSLGVRLALDDFGTGFSSLGYLTRFPIQKLKIDQSFVTGRAGRDSRCAVVEAIVGIAASLGLETTAEGVETEADLAWIRDQGCGQAQGYHFAKPMPASEIADYLASRGHTADAKPVAARPVGTAGRDACAG